MMWVATELTCNTLWPGRACISYRNGVRVRVSVTFPSAIDAKLLSVTAAPTSTITTTTTATSAAAIVGDSVEVSATLVAFRPIVKGSIEIGHLWFGSQIQASFVERSS